MASRYYGLSRGSTAFAVTESASTTSKQFEVVIDRTKGIGRAEFLQMIDEIYLAILSGNFPASTVAEVYKVWGLNRGQTQQSVATEVPTKATGTVTCASVAAADTVTFDGTVITARAATPGADEFDQRGTDTADAADLARALNANTTIAGKILATSSLGVVTLTPLLAGTAANSFTLATSNTGRLAKSNTTLLGGTEATTAKDVKLKLLTAGAYNSSDLALQVEAVKNWILTKQWEP